MPEGMTTQRLGQLVDKAERLSTAHLKLLAAKYRAAGRDDIVYAIEWELFGRQDED